MFPAHCDVTKTFSVALTSNVKSNNQLGRRFPFQNWVYFCCLFCLFAVKGYGNDIVNVCNFKWFGSNSQLTLGLEQLLWRSVLKALKEWWRLQAERETKFHLKIHIFWQVLESGKEKIHPHCMCVIIAEGGREGGESVWSFCSFVLHFSWLLALEY